MAKNVDWRGLADSTPSSSPKTNAANQGDRPITGLDWKNSPDSTPSSSPTKGGNSNNR